MYSKFKTLFLLDTKKVAGLAIIVALYVLLSWLSKLLNLSIFPVAPFLKIELTDFLFLLSVRLFGIFYSTLLTITVSWLRMAYLGDSPIDVFALMLADLIFLFFFWLGDKFFFKGIKVLFKKPDSKKVDYLFVIINVIIATLMVSFIMTLFNWLFIYDMYARFLNYPPESITWFKSILVPVVIPFNLIKFSINSLIFISIYRAVVHLQKQFFVIKPIVQSNFVLPEFDIHDEIYF